MKAQIKQLMRDYHREYQISYRCYHSVACLSTAIEKWGVEATRVSPLENRKPGIVLEMAGSRWEYVLRVERGEMVLGRHRLDGPREKLFCGSVDVGANWWRNPKEEVRNEIRCKQKT
jgi:hypothetical protein